jgi:hypothetical protein
MPGEIHLAFILYVHRQRQGDLPYTQSAQILLTQTSSSLRNSSLHRLIQLSSASPTFDGWVSSVHPSHFEIQEMSVQQEGGAEPVVSR